VFPALFSAVLSGREAGAQAPAAGAAAPVPGGASAPGGAALRGDRAAPSAGATPSAGAAADLSNLGVAAAVKKGARAAAKGDFAACAGAYEEAARLAPEPATFGELGLCEEQLGRHVAAFDHVRRALEGEPPPARGGGRGRWAALHDALERLRAHVARAIVIVSPPDGEVWLDGVSIGKDVSGRYVTVAPGEHTWTARRAGYKDATFTHELRAGDLPDVRLAMDPVPPVPEEKAPPCDEACRRRLREEGKEEGKREARAEQRAEVRAQVQREVQREVEAIYAARVDPSLSLFAGGLLSAGLTLDVGPGFVIGGDARWRAYDQIGFSVGLEAQAFLPTKILVFPTGYPVDLSQVTAGVPMCLRYRWAAGCGVIDAGMIIAGSRGPLHGVAPDATFGAGPRLMVDLLFGERFGVRAFADLRILLGGAPTYHVEDQEWKEPRVMGRFGLAVSFGQPVRSSEK
jgi:hypothetical protein